MSLGIRLAERGLVPDVLIRAAIARLDRSRLLQEAEGGPDRRDERLDALVRTMAGSPVAVATDAANAQHYEVPVDFFRAALGPRLKYSCCLFPRGDESLAQGEEEMLRLTAVRAGLEDGQRILELGCGWGSLTLWMAEHHPSSTIVAVSNSAPQRRFIEGVLRQRGMTNVRVVTADMNGFDPGGRFDRVVSVEMFEHMRNWGELFRRVASWLERDGRFFLHVFCHRTFGYLFEPSDDGDWMARNFFTGGLMPSADLVTRFPDAMTVEQQWVVEGRHYERTANLWLANVDARREQALRALASTGSGEDPAVLLQRWRIFFMACAELWGYGGGNEWWVSHYRLRPRGRA